MTNFQRAKLENFRRHRNQKLIEVDLIVNQKVLNPELDISGWKEYREALLDITEPYKNSPELLDNLNLVTFSWPEKPGE